MENLRIARKHRNMTQLQVANCLGISRSAYSHYETGFRDPDTDNLVRLADLLGVSVEFLLGIDEPRKSYDQQDSSSWVRPCRRTH